MYIGAFLRVKSIKKAFQTFKRYFERHFLRNERTLLTLYLMGYKVRRGKEGGIGCLDIYSCASRRFQRRN